MNQEYESYLTDLGIKQVKATQDYYLKKLQWALVSTATYQVSLQWTNQPSISVKEDITMYRCGSFLGHVIKIIQKNFYSPLSHVLDVFLRLDLMTYI